MHSRRLRFRITERFYVKQFQIIKPFLHRSKCAVGRARTAAKRGARAAAMHSYVLNRTEYLLKAEKHFKE